MTMDDDVNVSSAVDALRCLYLAREAERRGEHEAARRWQEKAGPWLGKLERAWRPVIVNRPNEPEESEP
jgi:uncharacterized membrane-anchored protein